MTKDGITIILAPLQGFTDLTFRNVFSDHFSGLDEAVAPFISTMGQKRLKPSRIKDVYPENNKNQNYFKLENNIPRLENFYKKIFDNINSISLKK